MCFEGHLEKQYSDEKQEDLGKDVDEFGAFAVQKTLLTQHGTAMLLWSEVS